MQKKYIYVGTLVVLLLASWYFLGSDSSENASIIVTPTRGPFQVDITTTGELRAKNSTEITGPRGVRDFRIFQIKIQRLIPEGTVVQKGDFVAELDRSEITSKLQDAELEVQKVQSQFEQAQLDSTLNLSQARDNLKNLEYTLEERQIAVEQSKYESPAVQRQAQIDLEKTQRQFEQDKKNYVTKVKQAEAKLREIEADLGKQQNDLRNIQKMIGSFTIKAPENGMVIYKRNRDGTKQVEGSSISAWDPVVAELPDFSVMESATYVNEVDIRQVEDGQNVDIGLDAMPEKKLTGVVTDVANIGEQSPNSNSKVFEVVIRINEPDTVLRPAMTTSNKIHISSVDNALYVPLEAVQVQDSSNFVFKRDGMETVMQQVILGLMNENDVVIKEGLADNDRIYLSVPPDTAGIRHVYLPDEVIQKYKKMEKPKEEQKPAVQADEKRKRPPMAGSGRRGGFGNQGRNK